MNVILSPRPLGLTAGHRIATAILWSRRSRQRARDRERLCKSEFQKRPAAHSKNGFAMAISPSESGNVFRTGIDILPAIGNPLSGVSRPDSRLGAPARASCAIMASTVNHFTSRFFASASSSLARSTLSAQPGWRPIGIPCALKNVFASRRN